MVFKTIFKLGIKNLIFLTTYKTFKYLRIYFILMPIKECSIPIFKVKNYKKLNINNNWFDKSKEKYIKKTNDLEKGIFCWFNQYKFLTTLPPNWFLDPYENKSYVSLNRHWSIIDDKNVNDLKNIWELSRWNWATTIARSWRITGEKKYIDTLNYFIKDWCIQNPVNYGFNWVCGQETSIRLINTLLTWRIINSTKNDSTFLENFIIQHLKRINNTIIYAESQDNNHWISEASALFIGGIWLEKYSSMKKQGAYFAKKGRENLEKSINKLIMNDGTFSQFSTNYHRLVIDTLSQVELWRKWLKSPAFSNKFYFKCKLSLIWLLKFVNTKTGRCPNIGGNDGAFCYQLHNIEYSNFKPSLQLGFVLFHKKYLFEEGPWDEPFFWLGIKKAKYSKYQFPSKTIELLKDGGFGIIRQDPDFLAILKIPRDQFRPCQADPLHLDLWFDGVNLLSDGGTYSYSKKNKYFSYFMGIQSHNTAHFDNQEPMQKISKFLWGNWLNTPFHKMYIKQTEKTINLVASYKFGKGKHTRKINYDKIKSQILIKDELSKFKKKVILRWRLPMEEWHLKGNTVKSKNYEFLFSSSNLQKIYIRKGFESSNYNQINRIPVIEVELHNSPCLLKTIIKKVVTK